jgi:hypothetical protein
VSRVFTHSLASHVKEEKLFGAFFPYNIFTKYFPRKFDKEHILLGGLEFFCELGRYSRIGISKVRSRSSLNNEHVQQIEQEEQS